MTTLLFGLVIGIPIAMLVLVLVGALMRISDKPTPPVTGPVGDDDDEEARRG